MTTPPIPVEAVPVKIISAPVETKREISTVFRKIDSKQVSASVEGAFLLCPQTPNRLRVSIIVDANCSWTIAGSQADAKNGNGLNLNPSFVFAPLVICSTDEIWVAPNVAPVGNLCAVIEYLD